jgi:hypothetical protein
VSWVPRPYVQQRRCGAPPWGRWRYCSGQCSCPSLISRASPDLWPRGAEISFCYTIDHCRTILYYTVLYLDLAPRRRYCRLFTLLYRPGSLPGAQTRTNTLGDASICGKVGCSSSWLVEKNPSIRKPCGAFTGLFPIGRIAGAERT